MKRFLVLILALACVAQGADAKTSKKHKAVKKHKKAAVTSTTDRTFGKPTLGTDHAFNTMDVNGRYQYPSESTVTVEDEKGINDLLGVRKHFKDRLAVEETRN